MKVVVLGPPRARTGTVAVGTAVFVCAWALMVVPLTITAAALAAKSTGTRWSIGQERTSLASMSGALIAAGLVFQLGWNKAWRSEARGLTRHVLAALALLAAATWCELDTLYAWSAQGFAPAEGPQASGAWLLVGLAVAHTIAGAAGAAWVAASQRNGVLPPRRKTHLLGAGILVQLAALYGLAVCTIAIVA